MFEHNASNYYARRAEIERMLAEKATDPTVALVHLKMARRYDDIVASNADISFKNPR